MESNWKTWAPTLIAAASLAGCGSDADHGANTGRGDSSDSASTHDGHGGHVEDGGHDEHVDMGMSAADMDLVMKQKTCPVSGEALGGMGTPVKKFVGDKVVFLCCKSCNKKFDADPEKYIAAGG